MDQTTSLFVEGNRRMIHGKFSAACKEIREHPSHSRRSSDGEGKGDAVRQGFALARNEILMIWTPISGCARGARAITRLLPRQRRVINGSRLVYPMEKQAMRFFNVLGNNASP